MRKNIRLIPICLLLMALPCLLTACGGGATVSGNAQAQSNASSIAAVDTIADIDTTAVDSTAVDTIADIDTSTTTASTPANATIADTVNPVNTGSAADSETTQSNDVAAGVVVQDPTTEPVIQPPEVALLPVDTDTDTAGIAPLSGTVETQSVEIEPKDYSIADITDLILVTGQSNALGADTSYDPAQDAPHKRVFAFTEDGWSRADLHQVWDLGWFPRANVGGDPSNNFSLHAAKEIAHQRSDRVIGFVLASAPGEGISHWDSTGGFFAEIDRKVLAAINQLPHKSGVDAILWHQGENDEGDHNYASKLDQLIANFRHQSWFASDRPFICGETAAFEVVNQQLMAINNNGDPWSACVDGAGLQTREDGFHFNAAGLRELGRRYAVKYLSMN